MDFSTNKILITGANGWLGKSLVYSLLNGIQEAPDIEKPNNKLKIKCLALNGDDTDLLEMQSENISIFHGDITNINDRCYKIIYLAINMVIMTNEKTK